MDEPIYRRLAEHLNRLPGGFGPSPTGADLKLLRRLFTPEEADLAVHLTLEREAAAAIAQRAGPDAATADARLEQMTAKGLVFSVPSPDGALLYQAAPWVVGIYEYQVSRLSMALLDDMAGYGSTRVREPLDTIPQMRTIPVRESIAYHPEVLPYEQIDALVAAHDRFAVAPCICRRTARMRGQGCDAPEETCLMFGDSAEFYVRTGIGRAIDRAEVLAILARADAANLVLQPTNSQHVEAVCCCCGCCCGILRGLKRLPRPSAAVFNDYIAAFDPALCRNCETCLGRCQMDAFTAGPDHVIFDDGRCIGCGLCVSTCPGGALTLVRKPESEHVPPPTLFETWRVIAQQQAEQRAAQR